MSATNCWQPVCLRHLQQANILVVLQNTAAHKKNADAFAAAGRELGVTLPHPFPIQPAEPVRHAQLLLGSTSAELPPAPLPVAATSMRHHWGHKLDEIHSLLHHLHHGQPMSM